MMKCPLMKKREETGDDKEEKDEDKDNDEDEEEDRLFLTKIFENWAPNFSKTENKISKPRNTKFLDLKITVFDHIFLKICQKMSIFK